MRLKRAARGSDRARAPEVVRSPVTMADAALFRAAFVRAGEPISDMTFASSFGWADALELSCALIEEHLCLFSAADGDLCMMLPPLPLTASADGRLNACLARCFEVMDDANGPGRENRSRIEYVSDAMLERIRRVETTPLSATAMAGDYVYPQRAMAELKGGALKAKRKLRSKFCRENPGWSVGRIRPEDVGACLDLLTLWHRSGDERHEGEVNERLIGTDVLRERDEAFTRRLLWNLDTLGLESMTLRVGRKLVGFTIGERLSPTQAVIYVEKTDPEFTGAPQFIFSEFCARRFADVTEINVGDDWGIATLRATKISYRPTRMMGKVMLTRQAVAEVGAPEAGTVRALAQACPGAAIGPAVPGDNGVTYRRAARADADAMLAIEAACFDADDRFTLRQVRRLIENPRAAVVVGERAGVVVGWAVGLVREHRRWRSGRVYSVAVDPACEGRGVGRGLTSAVLDALEASGVRRVYLEVRVGNERAMGLYRSLGFAPVRTLGDYYGPGVDGLRMRREVR